MCTTYLSAVSSTDPHCIGSLLADPDPEENEENVSTDSPKPPSLSSIKVVSVYETFIENARSLVTAEMENMVLRGLTTLVRSDNQFHDICYPNLNFS